MSKSKLVFIENVKGVNKVSDILIIGRQPGMAVRMPTPINQLFNDESIAVQIIFLDDYTWN